MKKEISKSQAIRMADFLLIGPFMIYLSFKKDRLTNLEKYGLLTLGIATALYNYNNWKKNL